MNENTEPQPDGDETIELIGEKIKIARSAACLTQDQLAERIGVTRGAIAQWESNTTRPRMDSVIKLAAATNSDFNWLFRGERLPAKMKTKERKIDGYCGWQCPGCFKMYSPLVHECPRC
jgi:transcriptional regulator with XRE-family HTH domain